MVVAGELEVCRIGFGALRLISRELWGPPADRPAAIRLLRTVVDRGMNFLDTADVYGPAVSEEIIAEALHPYDHEVVITTKGGRTLPAPGVWGADGRPEALTRACDGSLKRLRLDCIPLYQLHAVDATVPIQESVGALVALQDVGKIRHIGLSNVTVADIASASTVATIASVQNQYNVVDRRYEDVLNFCVQHDITFMPWQPVAKVEALKDFEPITRVARAHDVSPPQIALAWLLHRAPNILPVPGTTNAGHARENLAAGNVSLTPEEFDELSRLVDVNSSNQPQ